MNLLQFRTALRARVGNPTTAEVPDTELDERINEAVTDITEKYNFHKSRNVTTFPTVAGIALYALPADCVVVLKLTYPLDNLQLTKRDETWAATHATAEEGKPESYLRQRDWIKLFPTPDDAYTLQLFYKASAPTLVADADEPVFPSTWDQGVLYLARYKHWDVRGDLGKATFAFNAWKLWVKDKPSEIAEELFQDDTEGVVLPFLHNRNRPYRRYIDDE